VLGGHNLEALKMPPRDPTIPVWKHLLGGGLAGAVEISIMYPTGE